MRSDQDWMQHALTLAQYAASQDEVPVGAVIVQDDQMIGEGWNQPIQSCDPTAHAEIIAIRQAANKAGNYRLNQAILYVTLEPCVMCVGAIMHARLKRLVFGARDPKAGAVKSVFPLINDPRVLHVTTWQGGILEKECAEILIHFFQKRR